MWASGTYLRVRHLWFSPSMRVWLRSHHGNSLSASLFWLFRLLRHRLDWISFVRNHFRVVMRSRRVRLARALVLFETGLRRACPVGPEDEEGRSVQGQLRCSGCGAGQG